MKYYGTYKIEARYNTVVEADSLEEAKSMLEDNYLSARFGEAEDISGNLIWIEDSRSNCLYEQ